MTEDLRSTVVSVTVLHPLVDHPLFREDPVSPTEGLVSKGLPRQDLCGFEARPRGLDRLKSSDSSVPTIISTPSFPRHLGGVVRSQVHGTPARWGKEGHMYDPRGWSPTRRRPGSSSCDQSGSPASSSGSQSQGLRNTKPPRTDYRVTS